MYYYGNNGYYGGAGYAGAGYAGAAYPQTGYAGYTSGGFGGSAAIWIVLFILLVIIIGAGSFGGCGCNR